MSVFLQRLDIWLTKENEDIPSSLILKSWESSDKVTKEEVEILQREHQGDKRHLCYFSHGVKFYYSALAWDAKRGVSLVIGCLKKPFDEEKDLPATLIKEYQDSNLSAKYEASATYKWEPKKFMDEPCLDAVDKFMVVAFNDCDKPEPGMNSLGVIAIDGVIKVDLTGDCREKFIDLVKMLKPDRYHVTLGTEDAKKWMKKSNIGLLLRLAINFLIRRSAEKPIKLLCTKKQVKDIAAGIDFPELLEGQKRGDTQIVNVRTFYNNAKYCCQQVREIVKFSQELSFDRFSVSGHVTIDRKIDQNLPINALLEEVKVWESNTPNPAMVMAENTPKGEIKFALNLYPQPSPIRDFQEKILRQLGIAAPEDIPES